MRTKAKKRKIVPILVRCPVNMEEYFMNTKNEGARCREEIERELGRKAYEFAEKRFLRNSAHRIHEICVLLRVIDRGETKWR